MSKLQSDLYLECEEYFNILVRHELDEPYQFDQKLICLSVMYYETAELIINYPNASTKDLKTCLGMLFSFLNMEGAISNMEHLGEKGKLLQIGNHNDFLFEIKIKNLNKYLKDYYQENIETRDERVRKFIELEVPYIVQSILKTTTAETINRICLLLDKISDDNYFLSDEDLNIAAVWLVNQYRNSTGPFSVSSPGEYSFQAERRTIFSNQVKLSNLD